MEYDSPEEIRLPKRSEIGKRPRRTATSRIGRGLMEVLIVLVLATVTSMVIRFFVLQVYSIPSSSMTTTLQVGDRIVVNRLPVLGKQIERGDVVVFSDDNHWLNNDGSPLGMWQQVGQFMGIVPANGEDVLVKRVIGMGGDTVECCTDAGEITVNGVPITEDYLIEGARPADTEFSVVVPEGKVWVMGDNRQHSADSLYHFNNGGDAFVDESAVIGRVWGVAWPLNHWSSVGSRKTFDDVP
ncbi:signal peptidase I [Actinomycetaceae bacterium WB03_NA08]|uniref:Signal peptidase I n=1 Tax=Scrofimicrobium canadense TaxID=2652290 RepID=A0A6N7WAJ3_9ACTO|nr:signal peptidase I [Scrofimicrobium canadense]MSS85188.1 signal peptidase I [Scrofimicrobium canadense]